MFNFDLMKALFGPIGYHFIPATEPEPAVTELGVTYTRAFGQLYRGRPVFRRLMMLIGNRGAVGIEVKVTRASTGEEGTAYFKVGGANSAPRHIESLVNRIGGTATLPYRPSKIKEFMAVEMELEQGSFSFYTTSTGRVSCIDESLIVSYTSKLPQMVGSKGLTLLRFTSPSGEQRHISYELKYSANPRIIRDGLISREVLELIVADHYYTNPSFKIDKIELFTDPKMDRHTIIDLVPPFPHGGTFYVSVPLN